MKILEDALKELGIPYDEDMISKFRIYMEGILEWNEKINLTAITEHDDFIRKHLVDSVLCYNFEEYRNADRVIDVGTGGGFPGIPLAIVSPDKEFLLADSLHKRLKVIDTLSLDADIRNKETVHGRAEELGHKKEFRENFDVCVSRAVASLPVLAEYCLPFIKKNGYLLAYKGPDAEKEVKDAGKALEILGGKVARIEAVTLDGYEHNIAVIKKVKNTPAKYPRKAGTPGKKPLV